MTLPESATERVLRECGCPPYVIRCAHPISGALLWLTRSDLLRAEAEQRGMTIGEVCPRCGAEATTHLVDPALKWEIYAGKPAQLRCLCTIPLDIYKDSPEHRLYLLGFLRVYTDYDAALAAFHAAELELLRGGE